MAWTAPPTCISGPTALLPLARRRGGLPTARPYLAACTSNTSPLAPLRPPSSPSSPPPPPLLCTDEPRPSQSSGACPPTSTSSPTAPSRSSRHRPSHPRPDGATPRICTSAGTDRSSQGRGSPGRPSTRASGAQNTPPLHNHQAREWRPATAATNLPATQAGDRRYPPRAGGHLGRHAAAAGTSQLERVARDGGHPYRDRPGRRDRGDGVGGQTAGARPGQREHVADDGGHPHRDRRRLGRGSREPRQPDQEHHLAQDKRPAHHTGRLAGRGERAS